MYIFTVALSSFTYEHKMLSDVAKFITVGVQNCFI